MMSFLQNKASPSNQNMASIANALTIDVEDWFHGLGLSRTTWGRRAPRLDVGLRRLLDLLDKHRVTATFFVLGTIVEQWRTLLGQIVDAEHEIALHGFDHTPVYQMTPDAFSRDLYQTQTALRQITARPLQSYRAPYFSITERTPWALPILAKAGIRHDSSIIPTHNPRYGIPSAPRYPFRVSLDPSEPTWGLREYPISTIRLGPLNLPFSGGFYARFLPCTFLRRAIRQTNAAGQPVIFYLHPWELDPDHPRLKDEIAPLYRFTHYHNLVSMADKLDKMLGTFRFVPLSEVMNLQESGAAAFKKLSALSSD